jgi:hypothetical protein
MFSDSVNNVNYLQYSYRFNTSIPRIDNEIRFYWTDLDSTKFSYDSTQYLINANGSWVIQQRSNLTNSDWWAPRITFPLRLSQCTPITLTTFIIALTSVLGGLALILFVFIFIAALWYEIHRYKKTKAIENRRKNEIEEEERRILRDARN